MSRPLPPSLRSPLEPLLDSYTYHSPKPTSEGPYILGVDEAGRGPALGPLVYGVAFCPVSYKDSLNEMGFDDSKALTPETRQRLLETLSSDPNNLGWSVRVLSPQAISQGMLRRPPINLNRQSEDATILLIKEVVQSGIDLAEVYVDALGSSPQYQSYLASIFPGINFTVCPKADSLFKIVGAASVAAKVTRDAWIENWVYDEAARLPESSQCTTDPPAWTVLEPGSGYPSDPKTQAWLQTSLEPTFGFPSFARFSWATIRVLLENKGHSVKWTDEGQTNLVKAFASSTGREKGRCSAVKELHIMSVGDL